MTKVAAGDMKNLSFKMTNVADKNHGHYGYFELFDKLYIPAVIFDQLKPVFLTLGCNGCDDSDSEFHFFVFLSSLLL